MISLTSGIAPKKWDKVETPESVLSGLERNGSGERKERFDTLVAIKKRVLSGSDPETRDRALLTDALFFTCATFIGFESTTLMEKTITRFLEYGADPVKPNGRQLREEFEDTGNEKGLGILKVLGV